MDDQFWRHVLYRPSRNPDVCAPFCARILAELAVVPTHGNDWLPSAPDVLSEPVYKAGVDRSRSESVPRSKDPSQALSLAKPAHRPNLGAMIHLAFGCKVGVEHGLCLNSNVEGQRRGPASTGLALESGLNGWLPFAAPSCSPILGSRVRTSTDPSGVRLRNAWPAPLGNSRDRCRALRSTRYSPLRSPRLHMKWW